MGCVIIFEGSLTVESRLLALGTSTFIFALNRKKNYLCVNICRIRITNLIKKH